MTTICFIIPYFGYWPEWINLYFDSCANNPTINWLFVADCTPPENVPANVRFRRMSWRQCSRLLRDVCGLKHKPFSPYKLCDFKFAWGDVFREDIVGFDYWGFGDVDVIYGDIRSFVTPAVLTHDLLTFNSTHVSGHFTLLRNTREISMRYRGSQKWRAGAELRQTLLLDETNGFYGIEDVYSEESYNTPLSPHIPWTDGRFTFPSVWYYRGGRLYNNLNGSRHFLYLHFMRYKYLWFLRNLKKVVHLSRVTSMSGWRLLVDGFYPDHADSDCLIASREIVIDPFRLQHVGCHDQDDVSLAHGALPQPDAGHC